MNSTKTKSYGVNKNPFSHCLTPYQQMRGGLERNMQQIRSRFPFEEIDRIRSLLQEFDNNAEMVCEVLREEGGQVEVNTTSKPQSRKLSIEEQLKLVKNALLRLNKKYMETKRQLQASQQKLERCSKQVEGLRMQNKYLVEKECNKYQLCIQGDIY